MRAGYLKLAQDYYNAYQSTGCMDCFANYLKYKEKANGVH